MKKPILVTGVHRSGTTWVGRMLAADPGYAYISEPLNVHHRVGIVDAPVRHWYQYLCSENESLYLPAFQELLDFNYHTRKELASLRSLKDAARMARDWRSFATARSKNSVPLIKDPFAIFSAPWFAERLDCQVVIVVRHPAAFASSLKRLGWSFDLQDLLDQGLLMRDWLNPFRAAIEEQVASGEDLIDSAALLWRMIYRVVDTYRNEFPSFKIVRHEDLSSDPQAGFRSLYHSLGLQFTPQAQQAIEYSSRAENPTELSTRAAHSTQLDSRANLGNWRHRLTEAEIARTREATQPVWSLYYSDGDWE